MTKIYFRFLFSISLALFVFTSKGQEVKFSQVLDWKGVLTESDGSGYSHQYLYFTGASVIPENGLPLFSKELKKQSTFEFTFDSVLFVDCTPVETEILVASGYNNQEIEIKSNIVVDRKNPINVVSFYPLRFNSKKNSYEKLIYFELSGQPKAGALFSRSKIERNYAENSVLKQGVWHKFKVSESGLYQITYNELVNIGINPESIDPKKIHLYGNGGGMLPESNEPLRADDLQEMAIIVEGEDDGTFDENDRIIFYGQSPNEWEPVLGVFLHKINLYDDFNYYYLTLSEEEGKRINTINSSSANPNHIRNTFDDFKVYEDENYNLIMSGKTWYADEFGEINNRNYTFSFPAIDTTKTATIKVEFANRTPYTDYMVVKINNEFFDTITMTPIDYTQYKFAHTKKKTLFYSASGPEINVELEYLPYGNSSRVWLNHINCKCNLIA
ncbi:MAG: hypothetical protein R2750_08925 [Bacteroidales bacterium]